MRKGATVLQVEQRNSKVYVSYSENGDLKTIAAKTAIVACPKFIAKRIIKGLDQEHFDAMTAMHYQPYLVVNVCSNQVIYNGSFDTNIPAPSMIVDFNVADWVINRDNKEVNRPAILTCYVPRPLEERSRVLHDEYCIEIGEKVVDQLGCLVPRREEKSRGGAHLSPRAPYVRFVSRRADASCPRDSKAAGPFILCPLGFRRRSNRLFQRARRRRAYQ